MATTKIIAIRSSKGIENSTKYVSNKDKTTLSLSDDETLDKIQDDFLNGESSENFDEDFDDRDDFDKVIDYASNPDKTANEELRLISGHNCDPDMAAMEMRTLTEYWKKERNIEGDTKDAYHFIQSFDPKDNHKLTPELVHEIGLKFIEKIETIDDKKVVDRDYKALIATHMDKVHLHNHIVACAYDINTGAKYHDCKTTYRMLQMANDELCKEYGLSIILNPDMEKSSSWYEEQEKKAGTSWKDDIRKDIEAMRTVCRDWTTFTTYMKAAGYELREGKYITYSKNGHKVRDNTLGREYTKEELEKYWKEMDKEQERPKERKDNFYYNPRIFDSKSKTPYKIGLYDKTGRRRSSLELIILLAMKVISSEGDLYNTRVYSSDNPIFGKKDYKLQNMMDTISTARKEGIESIEQISERLNEAGKKLSHYKTELKKNNATLNKMEIIKQAIEGYEKVKDVVDQINALEEGPAKEAIKIEHKAEIDEYKKNKAVLYKYKCASDEQIADFDIRYNKVKNNISNLEAMVSEESSEYAKLKKLQNNVELAQNKQYLYGPEFEELDEPSKAAKEKDR